MSTIIIKCPDGAYNFEIFEFTKKSIGELEKLGVEEVERPILFENALKLKVKGDQIVSKKLIEQVADFIKKSKITRKDTEIIIEHYDGRDLNDFQLKAACEGDLHPAHEIKVQF